MEVPIKFKYHFALFASNWCCRVKDHVADRVYYSDDLSNVLGVTETEAQTCIYRRELKQNVFTTTEINPC